MNSKNVQIVDLTYDSDDEAVPSSPQTFSRQVYNDWGTRKTAASLIPVAHNANIRANLLHQSESAFATTFVETGPPTRSPQKGPETRESPHFGALPTRDAVSGISSVATGQALRSKTTQLTVPFKQFQQPLGIRWDTPVLPSEADGRSKATNSSSSQIVGVKRTANGTAKVSHRLSLDADDTSNNTNVNEDTKNLSAVTAIHERFSVQPISAGGVYSSEEDQMLLYLKETLALPWPEIALYFPWRGGWQTLQSRYSGRLKRRHLQSSATQDSYLQGSYVGDLNHPRERPQRATPARVRSGSPVEEVFSEVRLEQPGPGENDSDTEEWLASYRSDALLAHPANDSYRNEQAQIVKEQKGRTATTRELHTGMAARFRNVHERDRNRAALSSGTKRILRNVSGTTALTKTNYGYLKNNDIAHRQKSVEFCRPYINAKKRKFLRDSSSTKIWDPDQAIEWTGACLHVDFLQDEVNALERSVRDVLGLDETISCLSRDQWPEYFNSYDISSLIKRISENAQRRGNAYNRSRESIEDFLYDAAHGQCSKIASRLILTVRDCGRLRDVNSNIRNRQGAAFHCRPGMAYSARSALSQLKEALPDTLGASLTFRGTSGDVNALSWNQDGHLFAAGSISLTDDASVPYNLPNNLLLGFLDYDTLVELPDHATAPNERNGSRNVHRFQDNVLYATVSNVKFTNDCPYLLSAGFDNRVRVWDVSECNRPQRPLLKTIADHSGPINLLEVNHNGLAAMGAQVAGVRSIAVLKYSDYRSSNKAASFWLASPKSLQRPEARLLPSCLRWGISQYEQSRYLIAGFSPESTQGNISDGELCIWDVSRPEKPLHTLSAQHPYDIAWSPTWFGRFAVGALAGSNVNKGTRSVVRVYDSRNLYSEHTRQWTMAVDKRPSLELECIAYDMNDVIFSQFDDSIITAGCTDACTYVWDIRRPDRLLLRLPHGESLSQLDEDLPKEIADTGIRFLSWGESRMRLYSGSSDGVVKSWNPYLSPEDAHIKDVTTLVSGVMSGSFSPDWSQLLLGEVNGSITLLSVCNDDRNSSEVGGFSLCRDVEMSDMRHKALGTTEQSGTSSGVAEARFLLQTGQMETRPFGDLAIKQAVQGHKYSGPYDSSPEAALLRATAARFQASFRPQPDSCPLDHGTVAFTEEEQGDSGESAKHIPDSVRRKTDALDLPCFRCAALMTGIRDAASGGTFDRVRCETCDIEWRVNALGFREVRQPGSEQIETGLDSLSLGAHHDEEGDNIEHHQGQWL